MFTVSHCRTVSRHTYTRTVLTTHVGRVARPDPGSRCYRDGFTADPIKKRTTDTCANTFLHTARAPRAPPPHATGPRSRSTGNVANRIFHVVKTRNPNTFYSHTLPVDPHSSFGVPTGKRRRDVSPPLTTTTVRKGRVPFTRVSRAASRSFVYRKSGTLLVYATFYKWIVFNYRLFQTILIR